MARIRTIKPEFWKHEDLSALPEITHMLAAALLGYADDEGYFNANPALVKSECLPLRESSVSTQTSLQQLVEIGYIQIGRGEDGKRYGRVVKFDEHQRVNRPTPSKIKTIGIVWEDSVTAHAELSEPSSPERKGTGKGREEENSSCAAPASPSPAVDLLPAEPPVIGFLLNDGSEFGLSQQQLDEFQQLYPAIDVLQQAKALKAWCIANSKNRKTRSGALKFVNGWLSRAQNQAPRAAAPAKPQHGAPSLPRLQA